MPNKALQPTSLSPLRVARAAAELRRYAPNRPNVVLIATPFASVCCTTQ